MVIPQLGILCHLVDKHAVEVQHIIVIIQPHKWFKYLQLHRNKLVRVQN